MKTPLDYSEIELYGINNDLKIRDYLSFEIVHEQMKMEIGGDEAEAMAAVVAEVEVVMVVPVGEEVELFGSKFLVKGKTLQRLKKSL